MLKWTVLFGIIWMELQPFSFHCPDMMFWKKDVYLQQHSSPSTWLKRSDLGLGIGKTLAWNPFSYFWQSWQFWPSNPSLELQRSQMRLISRSKLGMKNKNSYMIWKHPWPLSWGTSRPLVLKYHWEYICMYVSYLHVQINTILVDLSRLSSIAFWLRNFESIIINQAENMGGHIFIRPLGGTWRKDSSSRDMLTITHCI